MSGVRGIVSFKTEGGGTAVVFVSLSWERCYSLEVNKKRGTADLLVFNEATGEWVVLVGTSDESYSRKRNDFKRFLRQLKELYGEGLKQG